MKSVVFFHILLLASFSMGAQSGSQLFGTVMNEDSIGIQSELYFPELDTLISTDPLGWFLLPVSKEQPYLALIVSSGYGSLQAFIEPGQKSQIVMSILSALGETVEVRADAGLLASGSLNQVEGTAIYAGRKTDVIRLSRLQANLAANTARQLFRGVSGLTIWENDGSGLQLAIGARGLDPNRTAHLNTRQNGYDISADALGYPESYYTPPAQAIDRIEVVRGAASLQYGTQFGGLLNFVLKKGVADRPIAVSSETTVGSFGMFSQAISSGGQAGTLNHYTFIQYRRSDGWRPNSGFQQRTFISRLEWAVSDDFSIGTDFTHMHYLAQQPGGLQDFEFSQNPRQSKRTRNWFEVNWTLAAIHADWQLSERTRLNSRTFGLYARRMALGELGPINRPDPIRNRNLIDGQYRNLGHETRLIHRYGSPTLPQVFLVGARLYKGNTHNRQGEASDGGGADFEFLNPDNLEQSDYIFPGSNLAIFAEHIIRLSSRLSITPGVRAERIQTSSDGYYKYRVISGGDVILDQRIQDQQSRIRSFVLAGIGLSYQFAAHDTEFYANASQNYRSINFSDLVTVNPNLVIDPNLTDEHGYTLEAGLRGQLREGHGRFDLSAFYMRYNDRIGLTEVIRGSPARLMSFRTQVGDAAIAGIEMYGECEFIRRNLSDSLWSLRPFLNISLIRGRYVKGAPDIQGNALELVPPFTVRTGIDVGYKNFGMSLLYSYVHWHYSDATNAEQVSDATRGIIPTYSVADFAIRWRIGSLTINTGINNLLNQAYFTRRATGYPGPGILPADGRSAYIGIRADF